MKKILVWAVILIVLGVGGYYVANYTFDAPQDEQLTHPDIQQPQTDQPQTEPDKPEIPENYTTYTSPNELASFSYPGDWYIETTSEGGRKGAFGLQESAWILSTFELDDEAGSGGIPEGSIKIDFEITDIDDDFDLTEITECDQEEVECSTIIYNNVEFTRAYSEEGQVPSIVYIAREDDLLYWASALFGSDPSDERFTFDVQTVDQIMSTYQIH